MSAALCVHGEPALVGGWGCRRCAREAEPDSRTARDRGMAAALAEPAAKWDAQVVDQAITHLARTCDRFSANDLRELLPAVAGSVVGARFMAMARRGVITRIGSELSTHAAGHARRVSVWRATVSTTAREPEPGQTAEPPHSRSAREGVAAKAARLLADGRVRLRRVDVAGLVVADVQGDSGDTHTVRRTGGRWACPCEAGRHGRTCGHIAAVRLVVAG